MKKLLAICALLMMAALVADAQEHTSDPTRPTTSDNSSPWVKLISDAGRFSILMPESAKEQSETNANAKGPYTTHLFLAKTAQGIFVVGWVDYDPNFDFSVQSELEANRDNFIKGVKATLLNTTKISLNGHPGLEFLAETPETIYKSRVYLIGRRPYQLISGTIKGQDDSYNVARFFDSFLVTLKENK